MRRNIFNRHKLKRKWGRGVKKASRFVSTQNTVNKRKDFAWRQTKENPFQRGKKEINWGKRIKIAVIMLALLIMIILSIYHSFFHIEKIETTGLQRISETEFKEAVQGIISYRRLLILPGNNYFLVNVKEIEEIVKERYSIEHVIIKKIFPNTLDIQIQEKISTVIYDNGLEYSYLDTEGKVVEILRKVGEDEWEEKTETVTSTNELGEEIQEIKIIERTHKPNIKNIIAELGDYPIVYDQRAKTGDINTVVLPADLVQNIIQWFNLINRKTTIPFGYVILENELGEGTIKTREGWEMKVKLKENIDQQFTELQYLLKEKVTRPHLNYIDLRYLGKVYWQ